MHVCGEKGVCVFVYVYMYNYVLGVYIFILIYRYCLPVVIEYCINISIASTGRISQSIIVVYRYAQ